MNLTHYVTLLPYDRLWVIYLAPGRAVDCWQLQRYCSLQKPLVPHIYAHFSNGVHKKADLPVIFFLSFSRYTRGPLEGLFVLLPTDWCVPLRLKGLSSNQTVEAFHAHSPGIAYPLLRCIQSAPSQQSMVDNSRLWRPQNTHHVVQRARQMQPPYNHAKKFAIHHPTDSNGILHSTAVSS